MKVDPSNKLSKCTRCGRQLSSGPFGLRCARCVLSLGAEMDDDEDDRVAELFPELRMKGQVARGGFGAVYRAEHRKMKRPVALKFLDTVLARSPEAVALFEQEMISVGGLDHPGIVRAHDAGERDGQWYIIMEFVDGLDCGALVRKHGVLPIAESCEIVRQAALALHHAHGKGLVHRDVKPGNLMVTGENAKVLDFGLAQLAVDPLLDSAVSAAEDDVTADHFLGTLEYVAPEQIASPNTVDARADIYALGATLRRMLTGQPVREGMSEQTLMLRMKAVMTLPVAPIAELRPDLPAALADLCDRMLALDPGDRPASTQEIARLIEPWCAGAELPRLFSEGPLPEKPFIFPRRKARLLWAAAAGLVTAVIAAAIFHDAEPVPPAVTPSANSDTWSPVFSEELITLRQLDENSTPRLFSPDWEKESETVSTDKFVSARFLPDGRLVYLNRESDNLSIRALNAGDSVKDFTKLFAEKDPGEYTCTLAVAPDGHIVWANQRDALALHIRRARPDGTQLKSLRYDFPADFPPFTYEIGRKILLKTGETVFDGFPWGMSVVAENAVPENTGLRAGDILIADEGHMNLLPNHQTPPALWRGRFDDDKFVSRLGSLPAEDHAPIDVTVSRHGVFLLNRTNVIPEEAEDDPRNTNNRVYRWDLDGFHPCILSKPLFDPGGLAADPLSEDLYAIQGSFIPSVSLTIQRVVRLRHTGPDRYDVELIADRFGRLAPCGIAFSADGKRLAITDGLNRVVIVLKRKA
jgi:serine/threonine protein kinase